MLILILKLPLKSNATTKAINFASRRIVFPNGDVPQFEFGMLAWQYFQKTSFVYDFTLNSSYSAIV